MRSFPRIDVASTTSIAYDLALAVLYAVEMSRIATLAANVIGRSSGRHKVALFFLPSSYACHLPLLDIHVTIALR